HVPGRRDVPTEAMVAGQSLIMWDVDDAVGCFATDAGTEMQGVEPQGVCWDSMGDESPPTGRRIALAYVQLPNRGKRNDQIHASQEARRAQEGGPVGLHQG